jgi:hypothetical protein
MLLPVESLVLGALYHHDIFNTVPLDDSISYGNIPKENWLEQDQDGTHHQARHGQQ